MPAAAVPAEPALSALSYFAASSLRLDARRAREEDFFIFSDCTASVAAAVSSSFDCLDFLPIRDLGEEFRSPFGGLSNAVRSSAGTLPQNSPRCSELPDDR